MSYTVEYLTAVNKEDVPKLDTATLQNILRAIETKLLKSPTMFGKPLRQSLKGHRSLRVEDYRIVYRIEPSDNIVIVAMRHRRNVYAVAEKRV